MNVVYRALLEANKWTGEYCSKEITLSDRVKLFLESTSVIDGIECTIFLDDTAWGEVTLDRPLNTKNTAVYWHYHSSTTIVKTLRMGWNHRKPAPEMNLITIVNGNGRRSSEENCTDIDFSTEEASFQGSLIAEFEPHRIPQILSLRKEMMKYSKGRNNIKMMIDIDLLDIEVD